MRARYKTRRILLLLAGILLLVCTAAAQSVAHLDPAFAGDVGVKGRVAPGQQEVSIYDLSYPVATKLGSSASVDRNGNFAAIVKPALVLGHQIVAVDKNGRKSNVVVVTSHPGGPAGPSRPR